jgi:hypothetical protein
MADSHHVLHHEFKRPSAEASQERTMMSDMQTVASPRPLPESLRTYGGTVPGVCPDDAQLCIEVRLALLRTCPTLGCSVDVSASDGVVHLRGSVGSVRTLVRMYGAARTVVGIHWVCNDVVVALPA